MRTVHGVLTEQKGVEATDVPSISYLKARSGNWCRRLKKIREKA